MDNKTFFLTIIMPALNEENNIISAIDDTLAAFKELGLDAEILVINDGSTDKTPDLVKAKAKELPGKIRMLTHDKPKGVGASFWDGVAAASGDVVCILPGDNENYPREILRYIYLLDSVDLIIPFVFNKHVRSPLRRFMSANYHRLLNLIFATSLNYTTGTVVFRKSLLKEIHKKRKGFFFQTDILIRLVKRGYLFAEVPYALRTRHSGKSKAMRLRSLGDIVSGYLNLVKDIYFTRKVTLDFASDSVSRKRYEQSC